jgi:hypothetical protein
MIGLVVTSIIDISIVKINDLIDKYFIPVQGKLILFATNSSVCLFLQFYFISKRPAKQDIKSQGYLCSFFIFADRISQSDRISHISTILQ